MMKHVASVLLLTVAVRSDNSFVFPDEVSSRYNTGSGYGRNDKFNAHGNRPFDSGHNHYPGYGGNYHGNNNGFAPGFGNHHGYDNQPSHMGRPDYGGIVSHSQTNGQSSGSGSLANSQSSSQFFNQISQSAAQSQAQSQGYQQSYPFGPSGGSGASSASSAASATSGIVNGVAVASASAAAAAAGSGNGGAVSVSSASSSSSSGNPNGFDTGPDQIPPWYFRNRIAGDDADANYNTDAFSGTANEATIVFSVK